MGPVSDAAKTRVTSGLVNECLWLNFAYGLWMFMVDISMDNYGIHGVYTPTNKTGGPHPVDPVDHRMWLQNKAQQRPPQEKTFIFYQLIKGSLGGETSVLRTFRMSGK